MKKICLTSLLISLSIFVFAQTKKAETIKRNSTGSSIPNKSESKAELFNKLRSKILAYGDSISDVSFSLAENELTVLYGNVGKTKLTQFIDQLDANGMSWEIQNTAIKFRVTSSNQNLFASSIRLIPRSMFYETQDYLLDKFPRWKNLTQDSINKLTAVYSFTLVMDGHEDEYNFNNLRYDETTLEINWLTPRTAILLA